MPSRNVLAHIEAKRRLQRAVEVSLTQIWGALPHYNREELGLWLDRAVPVVTQGQVTAAQLADSFLAREMGRPPLGVNPDDFVDVRAGVTLQEEFQRPFVQVWTDLRAGTSWRDAVGMALERTLAQAATDVQLASTHAYRTIGNEDPGIYGFERAPNAGACDLCLIASTQRYHTDQLLPIHAFCNCGVVPLVEPSGQIINRDRYERIKGKSSEGTALTVEVRSHGEVGPVLTDAAHDFKLY